MVIGTRWGGLLPLGGDQAPAKSLSMVGWWLAVQRWDTIYMKLKPTVSLYKYTKG